MRNFLPAPPVKILLKDRLPQYLPQKDIYYNTYFPQEQYGSAVQPHTHLNMLLPLLYETAL